MKKIFALYLASMMLATMLVGCSGGGVKVTVTTELGGDKEVIVKEYTTKLETLEALLVEKADDLGATMEDSDYGKFVTGMGGYAADSANNEFFEVLVDGTASQVGVAEIKLEAGKNYTFKLSTF